MHHQIDLPDSAPQEAEDEPLIRPLICIACLSPYHMPAEKFHGNAGSVSLFQYIHTSQENSYKDSSILLASYYHYFKSGACKQLMQVNSEVFVNIPSDFDKLSHF